MIQNGFVQIKTTSGGGLDEDGIPIEAVSDFGDKIPCHIQTNSHSNNGKYQDGKFIISSYIIFIPMKSGFSTDRVKLTIDEREVEFDVQNIEFLKLVGRIKITV